MPLLLQLMKHLQARVQHLLKLVPALSQDLTALCLSKFSHPEGIPFSVGKWRAFAVLQSSSLLAIGPSLILNIFLLFELDDENWSEYTNISSSGYGTGWSHRIFYTLAGIHFIVAVARLLIHWQNRQFAKQLKIIELLEVCWVENIKYRF